MALIIAAGLVLRVAQPQATVFCNDQARACALAQDIACGKVEVAGLVNSGSFRNLPGYVYLLSVPWRLAPGPLTLLYFTMAANLLAFLLAGWLMARWVGWKATAWGLAFFAAAPWAIHYCRWIWAQHLLFPLATLAYWALWRWLSCDRRWAACWLVLALTLLVQVHLAGVVLTAAIGLILLWRRPKLPWLPLLVGASVAVLSAAPYLLANQLDAPGGNRLGYRHFWRVVPAAAMSLSGLLWQLEFREGYPAFAASLGLRRWFYEAIMSAPPLLAVAAWIAAARRLARHRRRVARRPLSPLALTTALVVAIPLSFSLLGLRTSPTYLPLWYPLPFVLMGWFTARLVSGRSRWTRRRPWLQTTIATTLIAALGIELAFFSEQLGYIDRHGGVPGSILDRSYAGLQADLDRLLQRVDAAEVWVVYEGDSTIMDEAVAYLFRQAAWPSGGAGAALVRYRPWSPETSPIEVLPSGAAPEHARAYLVHPWRGWQQQDGLIPRVPPVPIDPRATCGLIPPLNPTQSARWNTASQ